MLIPPNSPDPAARKDGMKVGFLNLKGYNCFLVFSAYSLVLKLVLRIVIKIIVMNMNTATLYLKVMDIPFIISHKIK